jgi:ABC-type transport system involved in cytochrome c biogenesis permease component
MSGVTMQLSDKEEISDRRANSQGPALPPWWLIFSRELADLWIGGKALYLILAYTILLGIMTYVLASNSELSLIPPKEMVYETLKIAIAVSGFIGLIIGSDSLSGERERSTLEALLLTPTSRRQIVLGKILAGMSPWPVAMAITVPYLAVLAQGDEVLGPAILWGALLGSVMIPAYTGLGMFVSFWCNTNRTSFFVSLGVYTLFLVPAQLPGRAQTGATGQFLQWVNPMAASSHFLSKHLVNYRPVSEYWPWLESPVIFFLLVSGLLFLYASPGLRLEPGKASKFWSYWARKIGILVIAGLVFFLSTSTVMAIQEDQPLETGLQVTVDLETKVVKTGDKVEFNTLVTNNGDESTPPLIVAMNIINLDAQGDVVDPEDWSPQRTQYLESLSPGQSANLSWIINTILDGDYMVYMVVIPAPASQETTSQTIASSGIHLTVTPFTRLNPAGILPYAIGGPIALLLIIYVIFRLRRQRIDF